MTYFLKIIILFFHDFNLLFNLFISLFDEFILFIVYHLHQIVISLELTWKPSFWGPAPKGEKQQTVLRHPWLQQWLAWHDNSKGDMSELV